jgi:hypothetical protein
MPTTKSADLIRGKDFGAAVNKAVALAAERHQLAVSDKNVIVNWELVGRRIKAIEGLAADKFAGDVVKQLGGFGIKAVPAVVKVNKWIWVGFYERNRVPIERELGF